MENPLPYPSTNNMAAACTTGREGPHILPLIVDVPSRSLCHFIRSFARTARFSTVGANPLYFTSSHS